MNAFDTVLLPRVKRTVTERPRRSNRRKLVLGLNGPDSLLPKYDVHMRDVTFSPDQGSRSPPCQPRRGDTGVPKMWSSALLLAIW